MGQENSASTVELKPKNTFWKDVKEIVIFAVIVLVILIPLRLFVAQPFIVVGTSMQPAFETGQYLIVDELSYRFSAPQRGDVIIFKYPEDETKYFIKRIIGLPGETVILSGTTITIKNKDNPNGFTLNEPYIAYQKSNDETITLSDTQYFVMGDNRAVSLDSRSWGPLEKDLIIGKASVRLFPLSTFGFLPGKETQ